jgi:hypothetical protein
LVDACDPDDDNNGIVDDAAGYNVNLVVRTKRGTFVSGDYCGPDLGFCNSTWTDYDVYDILLNGIPIKTIDGRSGEEGRELEIGRLAAGFYRLEIRYRDTGQPPVSDFRCGGAASCHVGNLTVGLGGNAGLPFGDFLPGYFWAPDPFEPQSMTIRFRVCTTSPCSYEGL